MRVIQKALYIDESFIPVVMNGFYFQGKSKFAPVAKDVDKVIVFIECIYYITDTGRYAGKIIGYGFNGYKKELWKLISGNAGAAEYITSHFVHYACTHSFRPLRGGRVSIYKDNSTGDCSNNGFSSRNNNALVIGVKGFESVDIDTKDLKKCLIPFAVSYRGYCKVVVRPFMQFLDNPKQRSMFGGNFVWSCESGFRTFSEDPIQLHDRYEY